MSERASWLKRGLVLLLCVVVPCGLAVAITVAAIDVLQKRPATIIKAAFDANTVTFRDGRIQLYFDVEKHSDCATTSTRWLWTWVTYRGEQVRLYMPLGTALTGVTDIGKEHYLLSIEVPSGVWDGAWFYYERSTVRCGGILSLLRDEVSEIPPIPIQIQGSRSSLPAGVKPPIPPSDKNIPQWKKAIIMDGKPL